MLEKLTLGVILLAAAGVLAYRMLAVRKSAAHPCEGCVVRTCDASGQAPDAMKGKQVEPSDEENAI